MRKRFHEVHQVYYEQVSVSLQHAKPFRVANRLVQELHKLLPVGILQEEHKTRDKARKRKDDSE